MKRIAVGIGLLNLVYPSTLLRVVSLSNHNIARYEQIMRLKLA